MLIQHKADVEHRSKRGISALLLASDGGGLDIVRVLLNAGASLTTKSNEDHTPLMLSVLNKRVDIAALLIDRKAEVWMVCMYTTCMYLCTYVLTCAHGWLYV